MRHVILFILLIIYGRNCFALFNKTDSTILMGINTASLANSIFRPGVYSIGLQVQYFFRNNVSYFSGFNYGLVQEKTYPNYDYLTSTQGGLVYLGINNFKPIKGVAWLKKRNGLDLGYYYYRSKSEEIEKFGSTNAIHLYDKHTTFHKLILEGFLGFEVVLGDRLSLSPVGVFGVQLPFDEWKIDRAPSLGFTKGTSHIRFQAELWYRIR